MGHGHGVSENVCTENVHNEPPLPPPAWAAMPFCSAWLLSQAQAYSLCNFGEGGENVRYSTV